MSISSFDQIAVKASECSISATEADTRARLAFLTNAAIDALDELGDETVSNATPEQSRKILDAVAKRIKVLADRLDARAVRSTRFAL